MSTNHPMRIDVWQGDWGLPSIDVDCLRLLTLAKIASIELEIHNSNNPFRTPNGTLPVFHVSDQVFSTFEELTKYLKAKNIWPDYGLTSKQLAETVAYTNMLKEKLFPALQYVWWVDEKNCIGLTRPWYCRALPFPLNFYYPGTYHSKSKDMIEALFGDGENNTDIESRVYGAAEKCLTTLSVRLGESDFMFGSHPTSLDATLYAYLAPLLKAPFPNKTLQNHLKACTNLYKFVTKISQRYFPTFSQDYEAKRQEETRKNVPNTSDSDFPNKRRNQILAGLFAVAAMSAYALSSEIVQVKTD